ncbi:MAG: hypothetical protein IRY94_19510, partial [Rhodospirillaceae bacterium]|nr:hypothetical protein [Rhodospirillaceae bacterium]
LSFASVLGSHEWGYPAYVGLWYWVGDPGPGWAICANAAFAGFFPAAAFGLALVLGAARGTALLAGCLALLDPSTGVVASSLLKDSLAGFLAMGGLWALARIAREDTMIPSVVLVLLASALSLVRYVAFLALYLCTALAAVRLGFSARGRRRAASLGAVLAATWIAFGFLDAVPQVAGPGQAAVALAKPILGGVNTWSAGEGEGGVNTWSAGEGEGGADPTVLAWRKLLRERPVLALVKSAAHTLLAPYPWVAIHPGMTWRQFNELFYPGTLLWILCLPGMFVAAWRLCRRPDPAVWTVLGFLGAMLAAYTMFYGEWSTRQRVFALPAFFALAAIGWREIVRRWRRSGSRIEAASPE